MNDLQIRQSFHKKRLWRYHASDATRIIDELGLKHGRCRADIAVINGHLNGYEIKSDKDSLRRLEDQVEKYNLIFDRSTIIVGERHFAAVMASVPDWWGVILCRSGTLGSICFKNIREPKLNKEVDLLSVAELLWRNEAEEILREKGVQSKILRQNRSVLYEQLVTLLGKNDLKNTVRQYLKNRKNWRCH